MLKKNVVFNKLKKKSYVSLIFFQAVDQLPENAAETETMEPPHLEENASEENEGKGNFKSFDD